MNGVLIIDKPSGMTSHDVVSRVRRILGQRAVGHLGTLDPVATGVLPLVIGNMTRLAQFYVRSDKRYHGVIHFGIETNTYDADGEQIGPPRQVTLTVEQLRILAAKFRGIIEQLPPPFSAKKVSGVPAYKLARKGREVPLQPVRIEIKEFEITSLESDRGYFRAHVSSGTYMRAIAHELGKLADCGAHLESLRRTAVAEFDLEHAATIEQLEQAARAGTSSIEELLVHPRKLLPALPAVSASEEVAFRIRHGQAVNLPDLSRSREVKVFRGQRELIAISTRIAGTLFQPRIVLI